MSYQNLIFENKDHIGTVTFNRPKLLNALNRQTMDELGALLTEARDDRDIRVLILTGAGDKAFCAGSDLKQGLSERPPQPYWLTFKPGGFGGLTERFGMVKPVIAAVNGFALGGGCELALACSIRLASRTAKFGQPEVKLGIIPGYGGTQRLARLCGKGLAHELCLSGEMISAEEAQRIGLVNHVYEPQELMPAAQSLAKKIASNAPVAVQITMEAIERGQDMPLEQGLFLEASLFGMSCATEDMREGTRAFLDKRPAQFQGK